MTLSYRHPVTGDFKEVSIPAVPASKTTKIRLEFEGGHKRVHYVDPETSEAKTIDSGSEA